MQWIVGYAYLLVQEQVRLPILAFGFQHRAISGISICLICQYNLLRRILIAFLKMDSLFLQRIQNKGFQKLKTLLVFFLLSRVLLVLASTNSNSVSS